MSNNSSAETEAPETTGGDGPLLDLTDAGVKKFIKQAKARGYVTMGFSETTDFVHFKNIGRFNEPGSPMKTTNFANPKHGAVIAITPAEAQRLKAFFAAK